MQGRRAHPVRPMGLAPSDAVRDPWPDASPPRHQSRGSTGAGRCHATTQRWHPVPLRTPFALRRPPAPGGFARAPSLEGEGERNLPGECRAGGAGGDPALPGRVLASEPQAGAAIPATPRAPTRATAAVPGLMHLVQPIRLKKPLAAAVWNYRSPRQSVQADLFSVGGACRPAGRAGGAWESRSLPTLEEKRFRLPPLRRVLLQRDRRVRNRTMRPAYQTSHPAILTSFSSSMRRATAA